MLRVDRIGAAARIGLRPGPSGRAAAKRDRTRLGVPDGRGARGAGARTACLIRKRSAAGMPAVVAPAPSPASAASRGTGSSTGIAMNLVRPIVLAAALAAAPAALAQVAVTDAWVRGTVASQKATGAFMQLKSASDVSLVGASSPVAGIVEIHEMKMDAGVMRMSAIAALPLPAGKTVELKPGGYHVMLMALKAPLKEGDAVPVTLTFKDKDGRESAVVVNAPVKALTAAPAPAHAKH